MKLEFVAALAEIMARHALGELEYVSPEGGRVTLTRGPLGAGSAPPEAGTEPDVSNLTMKEAAPTIAPIDDQQRIVLVESGMTGTFYRCPAPGEPPFVVEGDTVEEGQPLGTIDAMKTMIPVESPVSGVLKRILVQDGDLVQPSKVLMEVVVRSES